MDFDKMRDLIEKLTGVMDARKLDELEIEVEGLKVALRRGRAADAPPGVAGPSHHAAAPAPGREAPAGGEEAQGVCVLRCPMVGTLYRAPAPDADPFVDVGDEVGPDTVLCIIEAMKVMNELKAEMEGTIQEIRVENGEAVEYGQPLFVIAPRKA